MDKFNSLDDEKKELFMEMCRAAYGIPKKKVDKINKMLERKQWEDEHTDLIGTDEDPYYVADMKSGKYKNKKDYYWKKHGVGISEDEND